MFIISNLPKTNINFKIIHMRNLKLASFILFNAQYILIYHTPYTPSSAIFFHKNLHTRALVQLKTILFNYSCCKIKFTGKGYKITKHKHHNTNLIDFKFNRAHLTILIIAGMIWRKIKKNKLLVIFNTIHYNTPKIKNNLLQKIRYANIFTKRGLKLTRLIIYKKTGKKSMK